MLPEGFPSHQFIIDIDEKEGVHWKEIYLMNTMKQTDCMI